MWLEENIKRNWFFCFVSLFGLLVTEKISAKRDMMEAIRFRKYSVGEKKIIYCLVRKV